MYGNIQTKFFLRMISIALILALLTASLPAGNARADDGPSILTVCKAGPPACQYTTLQEAIDAALDGDEIHIAGGEYSDMTTVGEASQIAYVNKSLTIKGGYSQDFTTRDTETYPTVLNAQLLGRVFYIDGSNAADLINVTLDGLQITQGQWTASEYARYNDLENLTNSWWRAPLGGGIRARKANLVMNHCILKNNHTPNGVGTGLFHQYGSFIMTNSTVESNTGTGTNFPYLGQAGGGLFFLQVTVNISDSTIQNNSAGYGNSNLSSEAAGGGIYLNHSTATIDHTIFQGNTASRNEYGRGGAIYSSFGSLTLTNSTLLNNKAGEVHSYCVGGAILADTTTVLSGNHFEGNTDSAVYATNTLTINGNTFLNNTGGVSSSVRLAGGVTLTGSGTFENNTLTSNSGPGGGGGSFGGTLTLTGNTFDGNTSTGNGGGLIANDTVTLIRNQIKNNTASGCGGGISTQGLSLEDGDLIQNNTALNGGGLCVENKKGGAIYQNLVIINNKGTSNGSGIYVNRSTSTGSVNLRHLTINGNTGGDGAGVTVNLGTVGFVNTIIANQTVGVQNISGSPSFDHTLRYQVTTPVVGAVSDVFAIEGDPAFASDGYHLTQTSAAIDAGITTPVNDDVDGSARPLGDAPDIGAVESPYTPNLPEGIQASQLAGTPRWVMQWDASSNSTRFILQQDYLVNFSYGNSDNAAPISSYSVKDSFPNALQLSSTNSLPNMTFSRSGNQLTWTSITPLQPGKSGTVGILGQSTAVQPGATLTNEGFFEYTLNSKTYNIPFQATNQVPDKPINPPFLTKPMSGEMCLDENGQLEASGITDSGLLVKLYENNNYIASVTANQSGEFTFKWTSSLTDENPVNIYAVACDAATPSNCSGPSRSVHLDYPQAFWCPQRSYWEGNVGSIHFLFHFVNDLGHYATNDFMLPGVHGFVGTQLHLYSCCDRDTNPFTVKADGISYSPTGHDGRMWNFTIGYAHDVTVQSQCQVGGDKPSHGTILIDPDGFVFDSTEGGQYDSITGIFSPAHALAGVTVTAYVYVEEWDSWIVWPASLYNNQVNPQVTGDDGYFAFFTPPGKYYLQATDADGYQTWRSPVIEVINEIVHANIPLTPSNDDQVTQVILTPDGPIPSSVRINTGESVEWVSTLGDSPTLSDLAEMTKNPVLRVLSSLDPQINILGFDGGRLAPGETFKRQFNRAGVYTYSDGQGHTAQVTVTEAYRKFFIPIVTRP